jgi:hypothetical protein
MPRVCGLGESGGFAPGWLEVEASPRLRPLGVGQRLHGLARQVQAGLSLGQGLEVCPLVRIAPNNAVQHPPGGAELVTKLLEDADFERVYLLRRAKKGLGKALEQLVVEGLNPRSQALILTLSLAPRRFRSALVGHRCPSCWHADDAQVYNMLLEMSRPILVTGMLAC